jgi:hypothetical protein
MANNQAGIRVSLMRKMTGETEPFLSLSVVVLLM